MIGPGEDVIDRRFIEIQVATIRSGDQKLKAALLDLEAAKTIYNGLEILARSPDYDGDAWLDAVQSGRLGFRTACERGGYL